jgi:hypothetical protein
MYVHDPPAIFRLPKEHGFGAGEIELFAAESAVGLGARKYQGEVTGPIDLLVNYLACGCLRELAIGPEVM